jgi:subtilisin family serine protease
MTATVRQYIVLKATDALLKQYKEGPKSVEDHLRKGFGFLPSDKSFAVPNHPLPSDWVLELADHRVEPQPPAQLVVPLQVNESAYERLRAVVEKDVEHSTYLGLGADLPFDTAEHWCPGNAENRLFGNRAAAHRLIQAEYLADQSAQGQGVNVVIIDRGISKEQIETLGGKYGGGWRYDSLLYPGITRGGHGLMIARNILKMASEVTFFDCPLLPEHIADIPIFLNLAEAAYQQMITDIKMLRTGKFPGPWIFVNAWAIYDRKTEYPPESYSNGPRHPFNRQVASAVRSDIDVVFCAGNCGGFCPSERCGANDRGPGRSIFGANSHPDVITIGAVRSDTLWLGYSSQGPGQPKLDPDKPDFCAPSQFCETGDAATINDGTSAACALAAGVVAALRGKWDANAISPASLKDILKTTATRVHHGPRWKRRLGSGILNVEAAYNKAQETAGD